MKNIFSVFLIACLTLASFNISFAAVGDAVYMNEGYQSLRAGLMQSGT